ncbi:Restriction of telomere capping protein 5, partial [Actinomortierella ambigua]
MGTILSKEDDHSTSAGQDDHRQATLSWESAALLKTVSAKFTEIERYSLRQVLQQVQRQRAKNKTKVDSSAGDHRDKAQERRRPFTLDEADFVDLLRIPTDECVAAKLFFRSFCNLTIHPDRLEPSSPQTLALGFNDLLKPLAFYCHKLPDASLPLNNRTRAIFESFAEIPAPAPAPAPSVSTQDHKVEASCANPVGGDSTDKADNNDSQERDTAAKENAEWDLEDDLFTRSGSKVKADDLVHVIAGILWLIQRATLESAHSSSLVSSGASMASILEYARKRVQDMIIYSRKDAQIHDPVDLATEMIHYEEFFLYVHRNMTNLFEILSPFFYNLFLIGDTMIGTPARTPTPHSTGEGKESSSSSNSRPLFPESSLDIPVATMGVSPSDILTPASLTVLSTFVPQKYLRRSEPMTCLYSGNQNGFSMSQFERHVCKYPAPTLLFLLVECTSDSTTAALPSGDGNGSGGGDLQSSSNNYHRLPTRRASMSFDSLTGRHLHASGHGDTASWGTDTRPLPLDRTRTASSNNSLRASQGSTTLHAEQMLDSTEQLSSSSPSSSPPIPAVTVTPPGSESTSSKPAVTTGEQPQQQQRTRRRVVLGAYVTETWKVSKSGWGSDAGMLFELSPEFEVFPARKVAKDGEGAGKNNKSKTKTSHPLSSSPSPFGGGGVGRGAGSPSPGMMATPPKHFVHFVKQVGIGFGGQETESCMLFLDDNLRFGTFRQDYALGGNVYMNSAGRRRAGFEMEFEIVDCEVWGLGGKDAKARQRKEWEFEQREADRRASIHLRSKNGEQDIDRDLL